MSHEKIVKTAVIADKYYEFIGSGTLSFCNSLICLLYIV